MLFIESLICMETALKYILLNLCSTYEVDTVFSSFQNAPKYSEAYPRNGLDSSFSRVFHTFLDSLLQTLFIMYTELEG